MDTTIAPLPTPSSTHATCAWCGEHFVSISALLEHVDDHHLAAAPAA